MPLLSLNVVLCEKLLFEQDQVISAIRIVEVFNIPINPEFPPDRHGPVFSVLVSGKVPSDDETEHMLEVFLIRPDGESTDIGQPIKSVFPGQVESNFPRGFNIGFQLAVRATQMGIHYVSVKFDGEEVRRVPFILQPAQQAVPKP
jgi:hypothetical protein